MKTQTKIIILLLSVTLIFIAGLGIIKRYESNREELLLKKNIFDKNTLYDRISRLEVSTLEIFAYDTSNSDDMVVSISSNNIDQTDRIISPLLSGFHVDAVEAEELDLAVVDPPAGVVFHPVALELSVVASACGKVDHRRPPVADAEDPHFLAHGMAVPAVVVVVHR